MEPTTSENAQLVRGAQVQLGLKPDVLQQDSKDTSLPAWAAFQLQTLLIEENLPVGSSS